VNFELHYFQAMRDHASKTKHWRQKQKQQTNKKHTGQVHCGGLSGRCNPDDHDTVQLGLALSLSSNKKWGKTAWKEEFNRIQAFHGVSVGERGSHRHDSERARANDRLRLYQQLEKMANSSSEQPSGSPTEQDSVCEPARSGVFDQ
jgi:hypothetical protein